jgi:hypothetical protein
MAAKVREHVMQVQVHLRERLLQVLEPDRRALDQAPMKPTLSSQETFFLISWWARFILRSAAGARHERIAVKRKMQLSPRAQRSLVKRETE